jgi:Flp pilus assembly protein TadG
LTPGTSRSASTRGSELVEFAISAFLLFLVIFATFEFARMALVYSSIANAAREGVRYATSNGAYKSSPASQSDVCNIITQYTSGLNKSALICGGSSGSRISVTWPDGNTQPGSRVQVTVVYKYDPFFSILPLGVNLGTTTQGYINY